MAGEGDAERLVVLVEARVRDLERNMQRGAQVTEQSYNRMRRGSRSATTQMENDMRRSTMRMNQYLASTSLQIGSLAKSFAVGFAGGIFAGGLVGVQTAVRGVVTELSEMGKEIDRVGLSAKVFQELKFGFGEAGVSASEFTTGMEQFNRRIGEAATRGGRLAEIFKANGIALRDQAGNIRSNEALLRDYANLVKNAGSEQERMTLATEAFGRGGAAFVLALRNGADGFDDMADAAANAGGVIDEDLIRKAEELDDRWAASWRNFEISAKSAIMQVISTLDGLGGSLDTIYSKMSDIGNSSFFRWLLTKMDGAGLISVDLNYGNLGTMAAGDDVSALQKRVSDLSTHVRSLRAIGEDAAAAETQLAEARVRLNNAVRQLTSGGDMTTLPAMTVTADAEPTTIIPGGGSGGRSSRGGGSRNRAADAALREMEAVNNLIDSLSHELSLIGMTEVERAKANALRQAGAVATDEQKAKIENLIDAIHRETEALRESELAQQARNDAIADGVGMSIDAMMSIADGSASAEDAVKRLTRQIMDMIVQLLVVEPLMKSIRGGGLGSLFGGGGRSLSPLASTAISSGRIGLFANGGISDRPAIFGEGPLPEAAVPLPDGRRIPVDLRGAGGGGETRVKVDVGVSVDKNGNLDAYVRSVSQQEANTSVQQGIGEYHKMRSNLYDLGGNPR